MCKIYIEDRKKNPCSDKLLAEVALYILIDAVHSVMAEDFNKRFGNPSLRTMYRYFADLERCGVQPRIRYYHNREYSCCSDYGISLYSARSNDTHTLHLRRIMELYRTFKGHRWENYPEDSLDINLKDDLDVLVRLKPEMRKAYPKELSDRTFQRDLAILKAARKRCEPWFRQYAED